MKAWFDFLAEQNTTSLQTNNSLCALQSTGILYVGGDDAEDFLQNQLSNDIKQIDPEHCQFSSSSNSKGRMYGIFRVICIEGGYLLLMAKSILPEVQQRLQKFVLRSRVVLADISDSFALTSITTSINELTSDELFPTEVHQVVQTDSLISVRLHGQQDQYRLLLMTNNADEAISLWHRFASRLAVNSDDSWSYQEMLAGIPSLHPATIDAFVLQMCNLDALKGVSFKKGCYPGQEVVARTHYLGKLKRRMFLATFSSDTCPAPGDELTSRGQNRADGSGKVVDAVRTTENDCLMLFVARIDKVEGNELVVLDQPKGKIRVQALPYALSNS